MQDNLSFKELLEQEENLNKQIVEENTIQDLAVIGIDNKFITVDLNMKSEAYIPLSEFRKHKRESINLNVGDTIPVYIFHLDDGTGKPVVSHEKAKYEISKENLERSLLEKDFFVEVYGSHLTKAGLVAKYNGIDVFIPYTLCDFRYHKDPEFFENKFIGKDFKVKIIKTDFEKNHIIGNHKAYLENEKGLSFDKLSKDMEVGKIYKGIVKSIQKYGLFVEVNHIDTLIKNNDLAWKNVQDPQEIFNVDQEIDVLLTGIDFEKERIYASHKLATTETWDNFAKNNSQGSIIEVKVSLIKEDYMIVTYNNEIDFLLHQDEIKNENIKNQIHHFYNEGDNIRVIVKNIDDETKRVQLSVKELNKNSTDNLEKMVGQVVNAEVIEKNKYGVKVLYQNEIIWVPKSKLSDLYNQDDVLNSINEKDEIEIKILSTTANDKNNVGTLITGESAWDKLNLQKNKTVKGFKVEKFEKNEVIVSNEDGIKGKARVKANYKVNPRDLFNEGDEVENAVYKGTDKQNFLILEIDNQYKNEETVNPTLGDVFKK